MISNLLVNQHNNFKVALRKMNPSAEFRPIDHHEIFRSNKNNDEKLVELEIRPVVFKMPERNRDLSSNLFIVVSGFLIFSSEKSEGNKYLLTHKFGSKIGYFRHKKDKLLHVFGAHYDFSENLLGHPVFHAQMKSIPDFAERVKEKYRIDALYEDLVGGMLRTVRLPCAQMDVFSLFLQICADHLINEKSNREEQKAFQDLLENNRFLQGAGLPLHPNSNAVGSCLRSRHWYIS